MSKRFADIALVRDTLKGMMPLDELISLVDKKYAIQTGIQQNPIERMNENLSRKKCDLDSHPIGDDGMRDSTASFTICPPKELWHCFGCGSDGDRFEYVSQKFNVDHIESIHIVAEIQGLDLSPYYADVSPEEQVLMALYEENNRAREIAHQALLANEKAMNYLKGRGMTDESIETFKLGYAPPMKSHNIELFGGIANYLALQLDRSYQFNDAILFPINNAMGNMRYFQSRPFESPPGMKYIGGDDTHPLFDETDRIFGFDIARRKLFKNGGRLVGVEGGPDAIACVQQGINAVGFLGTAINQNTFDILDRYHVNELVMLLDGDKAGRNKSIVNAEKYLTINTKVRLKIAIMPDGYDPEEYINAYGPDELKACIEDAVYAVQYLIDSKWNGALTPTSKIEYMSQVSAYLSVINDDMVKQIMIAYVAEKVGLDVVQVEDYYRRAHAIVDGSKLFSIEGEEILLGEALRNKEYIIDLQVQFKDEDWYLKRHRELFKILKGNDFNDIESIFTVVQNLKLDNIIQLNWLQSLRDKTGNVEFVLYDVQDKLIRRKSIDIIDRAKARLNDMAQESTNAIDTTISSIYNVIHAKMEEKVFGAERQVDDVMKLIHERMLNPQRVVGISFGRGFETLDHYTLGLMGKSLTVVSANQTVGKTQICENFAMSQSVNDDIPVLWFSLEMDKDRMTYRNLAILSGVPCDRMMTGNLSMEELEKVTQASIHLRKSPFYISERGNDLSEALAIARRHVMRDKVRIIYVDYCQLQYVTDRKTNQRYQELGWISKSWKEFAKEMGVDVVLISQLNKTALTADVAGAEHAAGSYEIAQDADNFITLKDKTEEEIQRRGIEHGQITMNLDKNRMGERDVLIDIYKDGPTYRMQECTS